jgi:hypothetical protein
MAFDATFLESFVNGVVSAHSPLAFRTKKGFLVNKALLVR